MQDLNNTTGSKACTSFMVLPYEIRMMVYKFVLVSNTSAWLFRRAPDTCVGSYRPGQKINRTVLSRWELFSKGKTIPINVLATNSTIHAEALPILYEYNNFYHCTTTWPEVQSDLLKAFDESEIPHLPKRLTKPADLSLLKVITFHYSKGIFDPHIHDVLSVFLTSASNLKILDIVIQADWHWGVIRPLPEAPEHLGLYLWRGRTADVLRKLFVDRLKVFILTAPEDKIALTDYKITMTDYLAWLLPEASIQEEDPGPQFEKSVRRYECRHRSGKIDTLVIRAIRERSLR